MMIERVNAELKRQISVVLQRGMKDPRVVESMVQVTEVKTTGDLKYAKVYLSFLGTDEAENKEVLKVIKAAAAYIRNEVKNTVKLRYMPELQFMTDNSSNYGGKIDQLLASLNISKEDEADDVATSSDDKKTNTSNDETD